MLVFFFFQAEDGIRDATVTGVQTCALPISFDVPMHGTPLAQGASATIQVGKLDESGNWPLKLVVRGLRPLPKGSFYEMYLTRSGRAAASCGTFAIRRPSATVRLNAPYSLRAYDGWIVTRETERGRSHPVVLRTKTI